MTADSSVVARLQRLFRGNTRAHGEYRPPSISPDVTENGSGGMKEEGRHSFPKGAPTAKHWQEHLHGKLGVGVVPVLDEGTCYFAAIDVDEYALDDSVVWRMEDAVRAHHLPLIPVRSKSGGCQLYIFFKDPAPAELVRRKLADWRIRLGLKEGTEIFPKQSKLAEDESGSWLNMPYFSALAGETHRYAVFEHARVGLDDFCTLAERLAEKAFSLLSEDDEDKEFHQGPPCLETLLARGQQTDFRNNLLFNVGVYYRFKRKDAEWEEAVKRWNTQHINPPLSDKELNKILKSLARKDDYNYRCKDSPICHVCNRALCVTRRFGVGNDYEGWPSIEECKRVLGDSPHYEIKLNGTWVKVEATELTSQPRFRAFILQWLKTTPPRLTNDRYDNYVNNITSHAVDEDKPSDSDPSGEVMYYLEKYLSGYYAETWEELAERDLPFTEDGTVYFKGPAFKKFLTQQRAGLQVKDAWSYLHRNGATSKKIRIGKIVVSVWMIKFEKNNVEIPVRHTHVEGAM